MKQKKHNKTFLQYILLISLIIITIVGFSFGKINYDSQSNTIDDVGTGTQTTTQPQASIYTTPTGTSYYIDSNGDLYAWGNNGDGEVGNGTTTNVTNPQLIIGTTTNGGGIINLPSGEYVSEVFSTNGTTFVLTNTGALYGWGSNNNGQVGVGNDNPIVSEPTEIFNGSSKSTNITSLYIFNNASGTTNGTTVFAINENGSLYGWGSNNNGILLSSPLLSGTNYVVAPSMLIDAGTPNYSNGTLTPGISSLYYSDGEMFAIDSLGNLITWGTSPSSNRGYMGISYMMGPSWNANTTPYSTSYTWYFAQGESYNLPISPVTNFYVSSNPTSTIITYYALSNGTLYGWGEDSKGQLGFKPPLTNTEVLYPYPIMGNDPVLIPNPSTVNNPKLIPTQPPYPSSPLPYTNVAISSFYTYNETAYAITSNNNLYSWGNNSDGQLGNNTVSNRYSYTPTEVEYNSTPLVISDFIISNNSAYVIDSNNSLYAWGNNSDGQLGNENTTNLYTPALISFNDDVSNIYIGPNGDSQTVYGTTSNGDLYAWGNNQYGQVGNGQSGLTNSVSTPYQISQITSPGLITSNNGTTLITNNNGDIYGLGNNSDGQLGNSSTNNESTATDIGTFIGVTITASNSTIVDNEIDWTFQTNDYSSLKVGSNITIQLQSYSSTTSTWTNVGNSSTVSTPTTTNTISNTTIISNPQVNNMYRISFTVENTNNTNITYYSNSIEIVNGITWNYCYIDYANNTIEYNVSIDNTSISSVSISLYESNTNNIVGGTTNTLNNNKSNQTGTINIPSGLNGYYCLGITYTLNSQTNTIYGLQNFYINTSIGDAS